jgi:hypothetical protein
MRLMLYVHHLITGLHQTLGHQKAGRQFPILSGRPHHHGDTSTFHAYFQWLFGGEEIAILRFCGAAQPPDRRFPNPKSR